MGGRGTFAAGNPVPYRYETVGKIGGVKVIQGINSDSAWDSNGNYKRTVFDKTASTSEECLKLAQNEPVFDDKTFWEAETDMEWIEW